MILRDPPVLHLLLHETCRTLEETVKAELVPKKEKRLKDVTELLAVALGARKTTRDPRPCLPSAPAEAMSEFYPILGELILEASLREARGDLVEEEEEEMGTDGDDRDVVMSAEDGDDSAEDGEIGVSVSLKNVDEGSERIETLARLMRSSDVIRKVALTHALRRLRAGDARGARPILAAAAAGGVPDPADEAPFAVTLARRLASLYGGSRLTGPAGEALPRRPASLSSQLASRKSASSLMRAANETNAAARPPPPADDSKTPIAVSASVRNALPK
jgi:negative elongation factor B